MKVNKKNKNIILIGLILILGFSGVCFFYLSAREIKGSADDYFIFENDQGIFVENKKAGLKIKAPKDWEVEKIEFLEGSVVLYSKDIEGRRQSENEMVEPPLTKGCGIETAVVYKKMNFDEIKQEIQDSHFGLGVISEEFEVIETNNKQALKNTFNTQVLGNAIAVYFTNKNTLYSFCVYWAPNEKQRCVQEFNKFLTQIIIE